MIDLEEERKTFEKTWMVLGGHLKYLAVGENQAYHLTNNAPNLTPSEKELTLSAVNTAWAMWLIQARAKQAEIDSLKAQLAKIESGEFVVVPKEPTLKMLKVADKHVMDCNATPESAYKAMIEAAQENSHDNSN